MARKKNEEDPAAPSVESEETPKRFVVRERQVDKFTLLRTRVEVTPSVCPVCGFDLLIKNGLPPFDELGPLQQIKVQEGIKEHMKVAHTVAEVEHAEAVHEALQRRHTK